MPDPIAAPTSLASLPLWTANLVQWTAVVGVVVLCMGIALCLVRIVRGPTLADRAVAADALGVQLIGLVILFTLRTGSLLYVDGILVLSLLGFAGTVAAAQFVARPHMPVEQRGSAEATMPTKPREESWHQPEERGDD